MANKRMFLKAIIDSARFIKMPSSSRLLYYDLNMRADDDGVVEGFNVLRMTGATEDDLRILMAKGYIQVLNDELVCHISNWREHNTLRADRKVDSVYKDLLLQVIPDVDLLERKTKNNTKTDNCLTEGGHMSAEIRLDKYSIDKYSTEQNSTSMANDDDDNGIFSFLNKRGFKLSESVKEEILKDIEQFPIVEFKEAARIADENGKHNYSYLKGILQRRKEQGKSKKRISNFEKTEDNFLKDVREIEENYLDDLGEL